MSQTSTGLWPRETPRQTKSEAERRVYNALKTSLPKGWYVWHSLKLRTKMKGEFSEEDFIIADPNAHCGLSGNQSFAYCRFRKRDEKRPEAG